MGRIKIFEFKMEKELYIGKAKFNGPMRIIVAIAILVIAILLFFLLREFDTDRAAQSAEQTDPFPYDTAIPHGW